MVLQYILHPFFTEGDKKRHQNCFSNNWNDFTKGLKSFVFLGKIRENRKKDLIFFFRLFKKKLAFSFIGKWKRGVKTYKRELKKDFKIAITFGMEMFEYKQFELEESFLNQDWIQKPIHSWLWPCFRSLMDKTRFEPTTVARFFFWQDELKKIVKIAKYLHCRLNFDMKIFLKIHRKYNDFRTKWSKFLFEHIGESFDLLLCIVCQNRLCSTSFREEEVFNHSSSGTINNKHILYFRAVVLNYSITSSNNSKP